jgi:Tol biopolymer transport system component
MRSWYLTVLLAGSCAISAGQIRITNTQTVPLPSGQFWMAPGWAPDGKAFYVTSSQYRGLWRYDLHSGVLVHITDDAGAGFGWAVSADGARVAYRRTVDGPQPGDRTQEIVRADLASGSSTTMTGAGSVDNPVFSGDALLVNDARRGYVALGNDEPAAGTVAVLGIENTKIALLKNGGKVLVDPFGDGSYIWPSLSPDGKLLLAYDMARGAFVCDLQGNALVRLGRIDAPAWTRNGSWIISMREKNDGHVITGADLYATKPDGSTKIQLTNTPVVKLAPSCSPVDNRILCATADGSVMIMTYEEAGR